jgi:hypothetical protein
MNLKRILQFVHLLLVVLYLTFVLFGPWAKRDVDEGVFSSDGGTGFGIIAVVLGVAILVLAIMRLMGLSKVLPGLGVEQLTVVLGTAATVNLIAFITGWLAVTPFSAGTGWAIVAAYFPTSFIPQVGLLTLSATEPGTVKPLSVKNRRMFSAIVLLAGAGVALFPFLTYLGEGNLSLSAFDGATSNEFGVSGPRLGYILLIVGAVVFVAAAMRLRPQGLAEPGANLLHSQCLFGAGLIAFLVPLAMLISIMSNDLSLDIGVGLWLGLLAGAVLLTVAVIENRQRGANAV